MTKFIALFYTLLAMLLIAVVSYSMQKSERTFSPPKFTIGVVLKAMDSEHWLSVRSGMTEAAGRHNMRLIVITAENETAFAEQNKIISDLLDNDIDALIVAPTNINHTKEFVDAAQKKISPSFPLTRRSTALLTSVRTITRLAKWRQRSLLKICPQAPRSASFPAVPIKTRTFNARRALLITLKKILRSQSARRLPLKLNTARQRRRLKNFCAHVRTRGAFS